VTGTAGTAGTAERLIASGRGILALDEGGATMTTRLAATGVPATADAPRAFRELLVTTPGLALGVSGVLLGQESFRQSLAGGRPFPRALADLGMLPGVRADAGTRPLGGSRGETVTEGLDGLRERLARYGELGARFAVWQAVLRAGPGQPSWAALRANAHLLARFASSCLDVGLLPVAGSRVLTAGPHPIARSANATAAVLLTTVAELQDLGVPLDRVVLCLNMVVSGTEAGERARPGDVAGRTAGALAGLVPPEVAGVALACDGQLPAQATASLALIARRDTPWPVTFCFGPALTGPALAAWRGDPGRARAAQHALANRVACNVAALHGNYTAVLERSYVLAPA
jgi:fructose-bisphosphate aldolase class I